MDFICGAVVGALAMSLAVIISINRDDYAEVEETEEVE